MRMNDRKRSPVRHLSSTARQVLGPSTVGVTSMRHVELPAHASNYRDARAKNPPAFAFRRDPSSNSHTSDTKVRISSVCECGCQAITSPRVRAAAEGGGGETFDSQYKRGERRGTSLTLPK